MLELLNQCAFAFDLPILDWIQANIANGFLDFIMPIITAFGNGGIFWMACAAVLLFFPKTRKIGLAMAIALALGLIFCNFLLKPLINRPRPFKVQADMGVIINLLIKEPGPHSFPSGHTIASFEASVALLLGNKKLGIPAFILAILIAFSRLYLYVHYPTDVFASIILGTLFAFIGHFAAQRIPLPAFAKPKKGKYEA